MDISQSILQAQNLIQNNQINQAKTLLREIIQEHPNCEQAWLLTSCVTETIEQSIYCLQQTIKTNTQSRELQNLLQQTKNSGVPPSISIISNILASADNFQQSFSFSQVTSSLPKRNETPNFTNYPDTNAVSSMPTLPEKIYFSDNQILVSNTKIVFEQTAIPILQITSKSYETVHPILARIFGVLMFMVGCLISFIYFLWMLGDNLVSGDFSIDLSALLPTSPNGVLIIKILGFFLFLFFLTGIIFLFFPPKKYRIDIYTETSKYSVVTSKKQNYTDTVLVAINKALADRGPYIRQVGYQTDTPTSKIALAWVVFVLSFGIPLVLALIFNQFALYIGCFVGLPLQIFAVALSGSLWLNTNPIAKANGMAITIIWLVIQCSGFLIGFLIGANGGLR